MKDEMTIEKVIRIKSADFYQLLREAMPERFPADMKVKYLWDSFGEVVITISKKCE